MTDDTTNIYSADAYVILKEWPFCRIAKAFGSLRMAYAGEGIMVSVPSRPYGPEDCNLGLGLTVRAALQAAWAECQRRAKGAPDGK